MYCRQRDRAYQIPAFEAACELLYRRRIAGATVLSGVDGADPAHARPQHGQFLRRDADVPLMVVAVGAGDRIAMLLPELGAMFRRPLMTIEKVRLCKRDGQFVSRPETASGPADAGAGMTAQFKLTVYASEAARHDGHPVHRAIVAEPELGRDQRGDHRPRHLGLSRRPRTARRTLPPAGPPRPRRDDGDRRRRADLGRVRRHRSAHRRTRPGDGGDRAGSAADGRRRRRPPYRGLEHAGSARTTRCAS